MITGIDIILTIRNESGVGVVLGPLEVRKDFVVGPAYGAFRCPGVVITSVAAVVDHQVENTSAAEHFTHSPYVFLERDNPITGG